MNTLCTLKLGVSESDLFLKMSRGTGSPYGQILCWFQLRKNFCDKNSPYGGTFSIFQNGRHFWIFLTKNHFETNIWARKVIQMSFYMFLWVLIKVMISKHCFCYSKELKIQKQPGYCQSFFFWLWLKIFPFRTKMCRYIICMLLCARL